MLLQRVLRMRADRLERVRGEAGVGEDEGVAHFFCLSARGRGERAKGKRRKEDEERKEE